MMHVKLVLSYMVVAVLMTETVLADEVCQTFAGGAGVSTYILLFFSLFSFTAMEKILKIVVYACVSLYIVYPRETGKSSGHTLQWTKAMSK